MKEEKIIFVGVQWEAIANVPPVTHPRSLCDFAPVPSHFFAFFRFPFIISCVRIITITCQWGYSFSP